jgi:hypothetical protein
VDQEGVEELVAAIADTDEAKANAIVGPQCRAGNWKRGQCPHGHSAFGEGTAVHCTLHHMVPRMNADRQAFIVTQRPFTSFRARNVQRFGSSGSTTKRP